MKTKLKLTTLVYYFRLVHDSLKKIKDRKCLGLKPLFHIFFI